jgi:hypothetical protein
MVVSAALRNFENLQFETFASEARQSGIIDHVSEIDASRISHTFVLLLLLVKYCLTSY